MAKTIEQIQSLITNKADAREVINEIADYLQSNSGSGGSGGGGFTYGAELVTNPTFDNNSEGWELSQEWELDENGKPHYNGKGPISEYDIQNGGADYQIDDVLTIAGGVDGSVTVNGVDENGAITTMSLSSQGINYSTGIVSLIGGSGSGAEMIIISLNLAGFTSVSQNIASLQSAKAYKMTVGVSGTQDGVAIYIGEAEILDVNAGELLSTYLIGNDSQSVSIQPSNTSFDGSIESISIKEITGGVGIDGGVTAQQGDNLFIRGLLVQVNS